MIHHECYKYSTLSSTFGRKEDSIFMLVAIVLMGFTTRKYVLSTLMFGIFLYNTGKEGNHKSHMFFVFSTILCSGWDNSGIVVWLGSGFAYSAGLVEYKMGPFRDVYTSVFNNKHKMNIKDNVRYYDNLPLYRDHSINRLAEASVILELLVLLLSYSERVF
jgi:hypothetical protein